MTDAYEVIEDECGDFSKHRVLYIGDLRSAELNWTPGKSIILLHEDNWTRKGLSIDIDKARGICEAWVGEGKITLDRYDLIHPSENIVGWKR